MTTELVQAFNIHALDPQVQQFYAEIEAKIESTDAQYRAFMGSIFQEVVDMRGMEEAKAWAYHRYGKKERTFYRYLQIARGDDPYPQLRQDQHERDTQAQPMSSLDKSSTNDNSQSASTNLKAEIDRIIALRNQEHRIATPEPDATTEGDGDKPKTGKPNDDKPTNAHRKDKQIGLTHVYGKPDHRNLIYLETWNKWGKAVKFAELNVKQRRQLHDLLGEDLQGYGDE